MSALMVPATIRMARVAPTRIALRSSARSTSGAGDPPLDDDEGDRPDAR